MFRVVGVRTGFAAILAATALSSAVQAHDIWITTQKAAQGTVAAISYGDLDRREYAETNRLLSLSVIGGAAPEELRTTLTKGTALGQAVLSSKPFAAPVSGIVTIYYDNGFWLNLPGVKGELNVSKIGVANAIDPHRTLKWGKRLLGPGAYERSAGAHVEIMALKDPYALAPGAKLPVKLLVDGKPLAGAAIAYSDGIQPIPDAKRLTVKTAADGTADIPIDRKGPYLLTTDITAPPSYPALTVNDHLYVSLSFDTAS